jgi:branched-chain amino acid transport system ATP-binding protein
MDDVLLEVVDLEAGYGEVQVLWGLSLKARRGKLTAIVGANGAGKTTTLRAIAGSIAPSRSEERRVGKECWHVCRSRWSPYH